MNLNEDCHSIRQDLTSFLDLELSSGRRGEVEGHLKGCKACTGELNELKKVGQWVKLIQPEPDLYFEDQLLKRVKTKKRSNRGKVSLFSGWFKAAPSPLIRRAAWTFLFLISVATAYYMGYESRSVWTARTVEISQRDLDKINQEIDFYKDYEMIHQLDLLKMMDNDPDTAPSHGENL
jgi:anti-sigma factor RsiW